MLYQLLLSNLIRIHCGLSQLGVLLAIPVLVRGLGASDAGEKSGARQRSQLLLKSVTPVHTAFQESVDDWARCQHPLKAMPGICPLPGSAL